MIRKLEQQQTSYFERQLNEAATTFIIEICITLSGGS